MRAFEKKKIQTDNEIKQSVRAPSRGYKVLEENGRKLLNAKETQSKVSHDQQDSSGVSDMNVGTQPSQVEENMVRHHLDDVNRWEDALQSPKGHRTTDGDKDDDFEDHPRDFSKDNQQVNGDDLDVESLEDTSSPHGDRQIDDKAEKSSSIPKKVSKRGSSELPLHKLKARRDHERNKSNVTQSHSLLKKPLKANIPRGLTHEASENYKHIGTTVHPLLQSFGGIDSKPAEEANHEMFHEATDGAKSTENDDGNVETGAVDTRTALKEEVKSLEKRVEKLEEELREVAALEISLYSVISDHGSSAHKVHTPARRLSRLYVHACKHCTPSKRATIARSMVSGLILVARTCGNDVARLTFWLSNTIILREIISQALGILRQPSTASILETNASGNASETDVSTVESKGNSGYRQVIFEDWQETSTLTAALLKIESWIFSRVVESVWWQALTPNMVSPVEDLIDQKSMESLLSPTLGDHQQGTVSVELWENAFQGAFQRLCPVRAAGHKCGCLPVLARMVMEQCVARLDVAMFNAILRESEHQIPTNPVSDPIVDSWVLPIPAGELSFGSGARLKNAVGDWSRWLSNSLDMDTGNLLKDNHSSTEDDNHQPTSKHTNMKCFRLLNELSELLMLPKYMLVDRSVRKEVCASINLSVIKRVLCNFSPDEFCPDGVPGEVLEALNAESFVEKLVADPVVSFPYAAAAVVYFPPSPERVLEKVAEARGRPRHERSVSMEQLYTSDEELDDLDFPLTSFVERSSSIAPLNGELDLKFKDETGFGNARYELLRTVWSM